jgi:hypothetical protein
MFKSQYQTNIGKNTFSQGFSLQKFHKIARLATKKTIIIIIIIIKDHHGQTLRSPELLVMGLTSQKDYGAKITPCRQPPHSWPPNPSAKKTQSTQC